VVENAEIEFGEEVGLTGAHGEVEDVMEGKELADNVEQVSPEVPPKDEVSTYQSKGSFHAHQKLVKSASDMELEAQLLPVDDPMLSDDVFFDCKENIARTTMGHTTSRLDDGDASEEEDEGWETESETQYSDDSFSSADYNSKICLDCCSPAATAIAYTDAERFIDSGWGGECLRETEDIDFEFVYALHTFVATVEGQANAQKGDTMVLLDDSNSYWWLVRVVKDSTIGLWIRLLWALLSMGEISDA
jgi:hypothetical protein